MFFPRRDFLKTMAWWFGASQVPNVSAGPAATASESPASTAAFSRATGADGLISGDFDLIVVGGGISGTTAAISAARNGVKVALVHERSMLGGNSSSEVRLYPEGNDAHAAWIRESGIHDEFHTEDRVRNHVVYKEGLMNCHWDLVLYEWVIREPNITLFLNTNMHQVQMKDAKRIRSIRAIQLGTEKTFELSASLFVDATGDGVLGYRAGADFRWGREAQSEYNESLAPEKADEKVMGNTLFFRAVDTGKPVPFKRPQWAAEFPNESDLFARSHVNVETGYWWIEVGAPHHPIKDNEIIRHEALRQLLGLWDHIKNRGNHGAENYALDFVGFWPYKRESRRIIGDFVVTQKQVQDPHPLEDDVAYGAWGIDIHCQGGILSRDQRPYEPPHNSNYEKLGTLPYGIPLRSLYSRNIENLLMAGRPMSASYIGFASTRVLSTGCIVGQAVGAAAGLCKKYNTVPRRIAQERAKECQQLILRQDGHIPGVENEDPADLARQATATASSEAPLEFVEPKKAYELKYPLAQLFPVSGDRIDTISLWMASHLKSPLEITIGLRAAPCVWNFRATDDLAQAKATIAPGHSGWVEFTLNQKVTPRKLYFVHAPAAKDVFWKSIVRVPGAPSLTPVGATAAQKLGPTRWEPLETGRSFAIKLSPESKPYSADNVIRGTHRPDRWPNIWISQPSLPAHVELQWPSPQAFNTVLLTFDTNTGRREDKPFFRYPDCVKDYDLMAHLGGSWKTIASVRDNYVRRASHRFDRVQTDRLRLNVLATNGAPSARVYEVRVYDEA
jgi:hypothetical protein